MEFSALFLRLVVLLVVAGKELLQRSIREDLLAAHVGHQVACKTAWLLGWLCACEGESFIADCLLEAEAVFVSARASCAIVPNLFSDERRACFNLGEDIRALKCAVLDREHIALAQCNGVCDVAVGACLVALAVDVDLLADLIAAVAEVSNLWVG